MEKLWNIQDAADMLGVKKKHSVPVGELAQNPVLQNRMAG